MSSPRSEWSVTGWGVIQGVIAASDYDYSTNFVSWLRDNPLVWYAFVQKTQHAATFMHKQRFSAAAIIQIIRWETIISEKDVTFKINNNHAPDLARLVMDVKPNLRGYFSIRGSAYREDAEK